MKKRKSRKVKIPLKGIDLSDISQEEREELQKEIEAYLESLPEGDDGKDFLTFIDGIGASLKSKKLDKTKAARRGRQAPRAQEG